MVPLHEYHCTAAGFAILLPQGWEATEEVEGGALVAVEPYRAQAFRNNVVVTVETVPADLDLSGWLERSLAGLRDSLNRCRVLDTEHTEVGGVPARRALVHYVHPNYGGVNLEQWSLRQGDRGFIVSATTIVPDYDDQRQLMATIAESLQPGEQP